MTTRLTDAELVKIKASAQERMEKCLEQVSDDKERKALLEHATVPGECDAEYCPWSVFGESHCLRNQTHHENCRCAECCSPHYDYEY